MSGLFRFLIFLLPFVLWAVDYDVIVIGTSPFSLTEALYKSYTGNRVLILEQARECGGSWKSVEVCGIAHADLGCHMIGSDRRLAQFLEKKIGCSLVSLDNPKLPYLYTGSNGFYFSQGCYEWINQLLKLIESTSIELRLEHRVESLSIDPDFPIAYVKTNGQILTASKIVIPHYSQIEIQNVSNPPKTRQSKYPHFYLLIADPTPPRFSYQAGVGKGISRMMNLTHFVGLADSGKQLIVFQTYKEESTQESFRFLEILKEKGLIGESAAILDSATYVYEQSSYPQNLLNQIPYASQVIEKLGTTHISNLTLYLDKWNEVFKDTYK